MAALTPKQIADIHTEKIARGDDLVRATPAALSEFLRCAIEADRRQHAEQIALVRETLRQGTLAIGDQAPEWANDLHAHTYHLLHDLGGYSPEALKVTA